MSLDLDTPDAVPHLDALVLHTLRPCEDPSLALQAGTYRPGASLELVGAAFGELIRRGHPDRMRWSAAPEIVGGTFPVLEVDAGVEVTCLLPVDRVFRAYQEGTDRGLARYFNVVVQEVIAEADTQPPEQSWPEILGRVVPVLKPAGWNMAMSVARQHFLPDGPVNNPLVVLAVDHPARISFLLDSRLEELGVTADEAFAQAFENLEARSHNLPARLTPVDVEEVAVLRLDCDDYFNASRALLAPALHAAASLRFSTAGPYLVGIPNRDILLLAAPEDRDQFYIFQSLVRWFHERQPAPISSLCFELGPRGIVGHRDTEGDGI